MRKVITITIDYNDEFHVPSDAELDEKIADLIEYNLFTNRQEIIDECTWEVNEEINEKIDRV